MADLTQACLTTHIRYIQCLYKDLANTYVEKLKLGKVCKEAERNLLIVNEYLESFYCFVVPDEYVNKYKITVIFSESPPGDFIVNTFSFNLVNATNTYTISASGSYTIISEIVTAIVAQLNLLGLTVSTEIFTPTQTYIYLETDDVDFESLTLQGFTYTASSTSFDDAFGIGMVDNGSISEDEIIENCLTTDQICCMIAHTYDLLKECNCN